jgi:hypothetical protein
MAAVPIKRDATQELLPREWRKLIIDASPRPHSHKLLETEIDLLLSP